LWGLTCGARGDIMIMGVRLFIKILSPLDYTNVAHRRRCCNPHSAPSSVTDQKSL